MVSGQLLAANPDASTLWNYRREIIIRKCELLRQQDNHDQNVENNPPDVEQDGQEQQVKVESAESIIQKLYENELQLTAACLMKNPKSYCAWHQRAWILQHAPEPNLAYEIHLCNKFLEMDERNCKIYYFRNEINFNSVTNSSLLGLSTHCL